MYRKMGQLKIVVMLERNVPSANVEVDSAPTAAAYNRFCARLYTQHNHTMGNLCALRRLNAKLYVTNILPGWTSNVHKWIMADMGSVNVYLYAKGEMFEAGVASGVRPVAWRSAPTVKLNARARYTQTLQLLQRLQLAHAAPQQFI